MRYVSSLLIVGLLTACDPNIQYTSVSSSAASTNIGGSGNSTNSTSSNNSVNTTPNQYIYILVAGQVCAYPIDNSTKDLIQPDNGGWCVGPSSTYQFTSMVIDPSGKYLYASSSAQAKIYQYSIYSEAYNNYTSTIPLTALSPATFNTNISSSYMSFGSNGNLYIQNYTYSPYRLDKLALSSIGTLSLVSTISTTSTETSTYGMNFSHITSIVSGSETYEIDASSNQIFHRDGNGVIQQNFQLKIQGTLKAIQLQ